jgi:hypothetical protein
MLCTIDDEEDDAAGLGFSCSMFQPAQAAKATINMKIYFFFINPPN